MKFRLLLLAATIFFGIAETSVAAPFEQQQELLGISFHISSPNRLAENSVRIEPKGLQIDNSPIYRAIDGTVIGTDIGDINVDLSPEIYVYVKDAKGSVSLIAYSANKKKSLSDIYLPPFLENPKLSKGYRGHDDIAVVEGVVALRFPIYNDADSDDKPTGGWRQLQYKLTQGEASWVFKLDKVLEF